MQQEETARSILEIRLNGKIDDAEREWILSDLPKLKSTKENRDNTISLLKSAILEEYASMDYESQMIDFLEKENDSKD